MTKTKPQDWRHAQIWIHEHPDGSLWLWANGHNVSVKLTKKGEVRLRKMLDWTVLAQQGSVEAI